MRVASIGGLIEKKQRSELSVLYDSVTTVSCKPALSLDTNDINYTIGGYNTIVS